MVCIAINAGQVFVELAGKFKRSEFDEYEKHLKRVREDVAKKERYKAKLGADFDNRAFNAYQRELKRAGKANDDMIRANGRLRTSFGNVWSRGGAAFAAAGGALAVVGAVKSVVGAYGEAESSAKRVQTAVDNVGISYKAHREEIDRVIAAQSRLSAFDDEDLADSFAKFVTQTKSVNEALKLNSLATDVARGRQISLDAAQRLVARGSQGNATALKRLGIEIDPVTKSTDKLAASHGKVTAAQKEQAKQQDKIQTGQKVIAALQQKFGGQAEAYGKTQQGSIDKVGVAWENLREKLGEKLAPTITRLATRTSKFIDEMSNGTGEGGRFADKMESDVLPAIKQLGDAFRFGGRLVGKFFDQLNSNERQVGGWISGFGRAESTVLKFTGTLVGGKAGDQLKQWGRNVDSNADQIDRWREQLRIDKEVDGIERDIRRLRRTTSGSFRDIRVTTKENMDRIRDSMTLESAAGRRAFGRNIRAAVTAIKDAMKDGRVSAQTGLAQIRKLMLTQLRELGIRSAERLGAPLTQDPAKANKAQRYMGGWLGGRGLIGHDSIPAMLAPGEAVLNRHQQGVIEGLLGEGFLDRLFATVNRPHFMQKGGRIPFAAGGLAPAVSQLANQLTKQFALQITSTTGGTHAPGSFHYQGLAADLGGAPNAMLRASEWLKSSGTYRSLLEGIHNPNLAVKNGQLFSGAGPFGGVWAAHANHIHIALRALGALAGGGGAAGGGGWSNIKAPQTALTGLLGDIVQGTLNRTTAAANRRGQSLVASMGGGDLTSKGVAGRGNTAQVRSWLFQALKLAGQDPSSANISTLLGRVMQESGGDPNAQNNWDINAKRGDPSIGLLQTTGATFRRYMVPGHDNIRNPVDNAAAAIRYMMARYGHLVGAGPGGYARGGRVGFARGGRAGSKLAKTVGGHTAGLIRQIRPVQTDRSSRFDALMARVDAADNEYARWERRFNISDEELVDADTGAINVRAIQRKAKELGQLIMIRAGMERDLEAARDTAKAIVASYRKIVAALRKSLRHATRKNRAGIRSYINQYEPRIAEWQGKVGEVGGALFDARTDVLELKGELKDVLGTTPQIQAPDISGVSDTGGGDTGGPDTAEPAPAPPTPLQIAEAAAAEMRTFLSGRQDLLTSFGRNFVPAPMGAAYFNHPDALSAAGGVRAFGGGSVGGGLGGATIVNNYMQLPDNTQTWSEQMRFVVGGG